jgi:ABC-type transporter Mla maintaining outer membrane lipid asymmetry ATPase subunit MlaF
MRDLAQQLHVTSLIVTHHIGCVRTTADRVGLLDGGKLNFVSSPQEFIGSAEPRLVRFLGDKLD